MLQNLFHKNKKPEEVFTPRNSTVNEAMYVNRPDLEEALEQGLRVNMHLLIHGESGSGKTWLYKKVLKKLGFRIYVANLAIASRLNSINAAFDNLVSRSQEPKETGYTESKEGGLSAGVANTKIQHQSQYTISEKEPFENCLHHLRQRNGNDRIVLVLDNLETIQNDEKLKKELGDIIILLDDEHYSEYQIRLLIVGVPNDLRQYFQSTLNLSTVANRIRELPEVARMTEEQCEHLVKTGLIEELQYDVPDIEKVISHISWVTDRLPQRIQEYCLQLATIAETSRKITLNLLEEVDSAWLKTSLLANYTVIESTMNTRDTIRKRKNQTLYSLSLVDKEEFNWSDIETILRREFPRSSDGIDINVRQILSDLSQANNPIIKRPPKGDGYCFSDPKYRMCLRAMLRKDSDSESVEKLSTSSIPGFLSL